MTDKMTGLDIAMSCPVILFVRQSLVLHFSPPINLCDKVVFNGV